MDMLTGSKATLKKQTKPTAATVFLKILMGITDSKKPSIPLCDVKRLFTGGTLRLIPVGR